MAPRNTQQQGSIMHSVARPSISRSLLSLVLGAGLLAGGVGLTGCGSSEGNARAKPTISSVAESRQELVDAKTNIGKTIISLNQVTREVDLQKSYAEYADNLTATKESEKDVREQRDEMREDSAEYIRKWQEDSAQYASDDLRTASMERQRAVKTRFADIETTYEQLSKLYEPLNVKLTDIKNVLANDLTPDAARAVRPSADEAGKQADEVQAKIDELIKQLDELNASLSSGTQPAR